MKRFFYLVLNPYFLSLWVMLIILALFPIRIEKYKANLIEQGEYLNDQSFIYSDLDGDRTSEVIAFFHNGLGIAALTVSNDQGILEQWTFKGRYEFSSNSGIVLIGDNDHNGTSEIYTFTVVSDSIFLFIIPDFKNKESGTRELFVSRVGKRNDRIDPYIIEAEMDDLDDDGIKELIFGIGTGYSRSPRRIFAYNSASDSFHMSLQTGYFIMDIVQEDIDGDGSREIIPWGYAADNISDTSIICPDTCSWLMVLNKDLLFAFAPVKFPGVYSNLKPAVISGKNGNSVLVALYSPPENSGLPDKLLSFDSNGATIASLQLDNDRRNLCVLTDKNKSKKLIVSTTGEGFAVYDDNLQMIRNISWDFNGDLLSKDIDLDGLQELVNPDLLGRQVVIFRNDLSRPVRMHINGSGEKGLFFSVIEEDGKSKGLYFQLGNHYSTYSYGINPLFRYRWLLYAGVYASVLIFTLGVRKIQRDQIRHKMDTERKINDLQLQIVRNQMDPHFIMNAVNSIIAGLNDTEKEDLRKQLLHFSLLHRSLLTTSAQIRRSLQEEIDFTRSYLALEKYRFRNKFNYEFIIDPLIDLNSEVPKMIIQIYAENALKHGIFHLDHDNGLISISISGKDSKLSIAITDNGVGREYTKSIKSDSTGKGTQIMQQYSELINKSYTDKIRILSFDLYDDHGMPAGTSVKIEVDYN